MRGVCVVAVELTPPARGVIVCKVINDVPTRRSKRVILTITLFRNSRHTFMKLRISNNMFLP